MEIQLIFHSNNLVDGIPPYWVDSMHMDGLAETIVTPEAQPTDTNKVLWDIVSHLISGLVGKNEFETITS